MSFEQPAWLAAIGLAPMVWWLFFRGNRVETSEGGGPRARWLWVDSRRQRPAPHRSRNRRLGALAALSTAFCAVALAEPVWGTREVVRVDPAREVLLALDLSRSMLAQDVVPSRLDRAKLLIESTLEALPGERVGLLLFAGTAFLQSPLSADHEVMRDLLPALEPDYLPQGGTDLAAMLDAAVDAFSQTDGADRFLVVLSDGESQVPDWTSRISTLREAGIQVIALGVGTPEGALIPDGIGGIVKDARGAAVLSRLESSTLEELADDTGGVYRDAATWVDIPGLVEQTIARGRAVESIEERRATAIHRYQWVLAPAWLLMVLSYVFEFPTVLRARALKRGAGSNPSQPVLASASSMLLLGLVLSGASTANALPGDPTEGAPTEEIAPPESPIAAVVARVARTRHPSARDYADLAIETLAVGTQAASNGEALPPGVVGDALVAVDVGERADVDAADWSQLRADLEAMLDPPQEQGSDGEPQSSGEDGSEGESGESGESGDEGEGDGSDASQDEGGEADGAESDGEGGESQSDSEEADAEGGDDGDGAEGSASNRDGESPEQADAGEDGRDESHEGETPRGDPTALEEESAGLADLAEPDGGEEPDAAQDPASAASAASDVPEASPEPARETRMVGGGGARNQDLLEGRPDLAAAVGRMEQVRDGDAPSVLFERMGEAEGVPRNPNGPDW